MSSRGPPSRSRKREANSPPPDEPTPTKRLAVPDIKRTESVYQIRTAPGKGLGLFARCDIPRGHRILLEKPMVTISASQDQSDAYKAFLDLDQATQATYLTLTYAADDDRLEHFATQLANDKSIPANQRRNLDLDEGARVIAIWEANAFGLGHTLRFGSGIFNTATRVNHSCQPNATHTWNETLGCQTVHAMQDIAKGEEITMAYVRPLQATSGRQEYLKRIYGFECMCKACDVRTEEGVQSTYRRRRIQGLNDFLDEEGYDELEGEVGIATIKEVLRLMGLEGVVSWDKGKRLSDLADLYEDKEEYKNAVKCERQALEIVVNSFGEDDEVTDDVSRNLRKLEAKLREQTARIRESAPVTPAKNLLRDHPSSAQAAIKQLREQKKTPK